MINAEVGAWTNNPFSFVVGTDMDNHTALQECILKHSETAAVKTV